MSSHNSQDGTQASISQANSLQIEIECHGLYYPTQKQQMKKLLARQSRRPNHRSRKSKLPSLNNTDLHAWRDEEDEDSAEEIEDGVENDVATLSPGVVTVHVIGKASPGCAQTILPPPLCPSVSPDLDEDEDEERTADDFIMIAGSEEEEDGDDTVHRFAGGEDGWSVLDGGDIDETSSQWTFTSDHHGTFLTAALSALGASSDLESQAQRLQNTEAAQLNNWRRIVKKHSTTDDDIDLEGEYLAYKSDGAKGRTVRAGRRYRKGRG
jgi:hypothetical protein